MSLSIKYTKVSLTLKPGFFLSSPTPTALADISCIVLWETWNVALTPQNPGLSRK